MSSVILAGARTPIGKFAGAFKDVPAVTLGGHAIRAALERSGVEGKDVDYVIMGQVLQAGAGQITARQAAVKAGIPMTVPATTVNKVCLSGLNTIYLADQMIAAGDAEIVVAGGMESMTNAPYLLPEARAGYRMGDKSVVDAMMYDGLFCASSGSYCFYVGGVNAVCQSDHECAKDLQCLSGACHTPGYIMCASPTMSSARALPASLRSLPSPASSISTSPMSAAS